MGHPSHLATLSNVPKKATKLSSGESLVGTLWMLWIRLGRGKAAARLIYHRLINSTVGVCRPLAISSMTWAWQMLASRRY